MFEFFLVLIFLLVVFVGLPGYYVARGYARLSRCAGNIRRAAGALLTEQDKFEAMHRRFELAAQQYLDHEQVTLIATNAREHSFDASSGGYYQQVIQQNPALQANAEVRNAIHEEERLNEQLAAYRRQFYARIEDYNDARNDFPNFLFASRIGFREADMVEIRSFDDLRDLKEFASGTGDQFKQMLSDVGSNVAERGKRIKNDVRNRRQLAREEQEQIGRSEHVEMEATWEEVGHGDQSDSSEQLEESLVNRERERIDQPATDYETRIEQQAFDTSTEETKREPEVEVSNEKTNVDSSKGEEDVNASDEASQKTVKKSVDGT